MALVSTLASMAALTLLQHPEHQPEGVSVDYTPFRDPAITIQRMLRGFITRIRIIRSITIQRMLRGFMTRIRIVRRTHFARRWGLRNGLYECGPQRARSVGLAKW